MVKTCKQSEQERVIVTRGLKQKEDFVYHMKRTWEAKASLPEG